VDDLVLIGAGGHARACADVIQAQGKFRIAGVVLAERSKAYSDLGWDILGYDDEIGDLRKNFRHALVCIGQIKTWQARVRAFELCIAAGLELPVIVSPLAYVSPSAKIGAGTIVMHHAIVNSRAAVGTNSILNTRCLIEHDAVIGDHCHVSTGGIVNGNASVGSRTFVGSGAVVEHNSVVKEEMAVPAQSFFRK